MTHLKTIILTFLIFCSITTFAQKVNFSGTWTIDTVKTAFGQAPKTVIPRTVKVEQQVARLVLTRISNNAQGQEQPPVTETLAFDGTPLQRTTGGSQVTTTLHWLNDASIMLTRNGAALIATETWTLEDNGKTLVIDRAVEQKENGFKYTLKGYYKKQ